MVVGDGIAERSEAGGEVIELAVVRGYDFAQAGDLGGEIVELAVVPRHSARLAAAAGRRLQCQAH
jgi:hypothetical protein